MKLDIVHNINPEKLDYGIRHVGKEKISYLVMNDDTKIALSTDNSGRVLNYIGSKNSFYAKYMDIPIAIYNGMQYGEVNIVTETK